VQEWYGLAPADVEGAIIWEPLLIKIRDAEQIIADIRENMTRQRKAQEQEKADARAMESDMWSTGTDGADADEVCGEDGDDPVPTPSGDDGSESTTSRKRRERTAGDGEAAAVGAGPTKRARTGMVTASGGRCGRSGPQKATSSTQRTVSTCRAKGCDG